MKAWDGTVDAIRPKERMTRSSDVENVAAGRYFRSKPFTTMTKKRKGAIRDAETCSKSMNVPRTTQTL